jgi:hypothetical protein
MDTADDSGAADPPQVIFSSAYGGLPRFILYGVIPFLLLVSAVFMVRAVWFNEGLLLKSIRVSPGVVAFVICPVIWSLCGLLAALEVYRYRNPQFVLASTWGVRLPKGRFTAETVSIAWDDLQASLEGSNLKGWHVYELHCSHLQTGESARVTSALFRDFDDFATFSNILAEHMGQDWTIKGFWPGTVRGRKSDRR